MCGLHELLKYFDIIFGRLFLQVSGEKFRETKSIILKCKKETKIFIIFLRTMKGHYRFFKGPFKKKDNK